MRLFARRDQELDIPVTAAGKNIRIGTAVNTLPKKKPKIKIGTAVKYAEKDGKPLSMPDGSYPIPDVDHLHKAIQAFGRAKDPEAVKRWIVKRARALDSVDLLPESWNVTAAISEDGDVLPQLFTVRQNEGGRFELLNPEGTKVAETIDHGDAQDICDARNGVSVEPALVADDDPFMEDLAAALAKPLENPGEVWAFVPGMDHPDLEMAAIVASIPVNPPADWFFMDEPDEPTPMTVTSDGQVYGHAAIWGTCHLGNPRGAGVCVQPPVSQTDYALFHLGELQADGGDKVAVGQITLDTGHAPMGASARTAAAHYDDTGAVVADVRAKNGVHGIFYSGALRPDVSPSQVRKLTASKISGDWRGGELVGMLCVNVPGFPVPRTQARLVASAGGVEEVMALVAAGIIGEARTPADVALDVHLLAAAAEGIDPIDALVALAEDGIVPDDDSIDILTAAVEIERINIRITEDSREMPTLNASLEREVAMQVDFFRDHGYWPTESLSGGAFTAAEMQNAQTAGALLVVDPLQGASVDLRDRLISRGLLV